MHNTATEITITANTEELIGILNENCTRHVEEYNKALEGWRFKIVEDAKKLIDRMTGDDWRDAYESSVSHARPTCYEPAYKQAIGMLGMHTEETIILDSETYRCFVDDKWDWSHRNDLLNSTYMVGG